MHAAQNSAHSEARDKLNQPNTLNRNLNLSVVIPLYNRRASLQTVMNSALADMRDGDELIVIDDGSCDGSYEEACRCGGERKNVRVVRQENLGVSAARNNGAHLASHKVIVFLDSDDEILPGALDKVRTAFAQGIDFCWGSVIYQHANGSSRTKHFSNIDRLKRPQDYVLGMASSFCFSIRKSVFESVGGFDENMRSVEDTELAIRLRHHNYIVLEQACFQINSGTSNNQLTRNDVSRIASMRYMLSKHGPVIRKYPFYNKLILKSLYKCALRADDANALRLAFYSYIRQHPYKLKIIASFVAYSLFRIKWLP